MSFRGENKCKWLFSSAKPGKNEDTGGGSSGARPWSVVNTSQMTVSYIVTGGAHAQADSWFYWLRQWWRETETFGFWAHGSDGALYWPQYCSSFASHVAHSKDIRLAGTCCLLLWQAELRCLNQSKAFIRFPAWYLYVLPCSESVSINTSGCSGSSAIIAMSPTTHTLLQDVDLKCFRSVAFRDLAA